MGTIFCCFGSSLCQVLRGSEYIYWGYSNGRYIPFSGKTAQLYRVLEMDASVFKIAQILASLTTVIWVLSVTLSYSTRSRNSGSVTFYYRDSKKSRTSDFLSEEAIASLNMRKHEEEARTRLNETMINKILVAINIAGDPLKVPNTFLITNSTSDFLLKFTVQRLRLRVSERMEKATLHLKETGTIEQRYRGRTPLHISSNFDSQGGLGNWMFMMGSMFGLSRINKRIPVVLYNYSHFDRHFESFKLKRMDRVAFVGSERKEAWQSDVVREIAPGVYTKWLTNVSSVHGNRNVLLEGYLQSWRYFDRFRTEIKSLFTFSKNVYMKSMKAILAGSEAPSIKKYFNEARTRMGTATLVGIHVRRGDILTSNQRNHGHRPATDQYLLRAALRFQRMYSPVMFVVVSNDIDYCRILFPEPNFVFIQNTTPEIDMAVLTLMDHVILTVGSFGWWGAYLSDAKEVLYYKNWPENGSEMENMFEPEDYFLPAWKGSL